MSSSPRPGPSDITAQLRRAVETGDWQSLAEVIHPNVLWGAPEGGGTGCRGRSAVLSRCAALHAEGPRVTVDEIFTFPAAVVLGLHPQRALPTPGPNTAVYQVYDITGGLITRIAGYADRSAALDAAYTGAATTGL
ncbi:nuclear transport factor 2 family protein [Streptomyces diastatochromogenes]|uniref:SnoaL-like domain-containing protein n=1 Tax=Streptomyces diastatochromogenes TaxID=42236 RepID=A0A233RSL4_STRDA|nr:nuclear transport factor 2 family protein [Streptomyces diastatochromogenes]MCZ0984755.1 nuclear transport factor 2 family protein [Streptomyces diastatochromogenes]OXY86382.1 hypothetical protein BEK98_44665 [Streptomyces diastatochromogenes]